MHQYGTHNDIISEYFCKEPKDHLFSHEIIEDEYKHESFNNDY